MRTLTANDIAKRIQRPGESLRSAVDRLRNWTKEGIIKPVGDAHPGTGRKKQYAENAAVTAGILQALSDATGGTAVYLSFVAEEIERDISKAAKDGLVF